MRDNYLILFSRIAVIVLQLVSIKLLTTYLNAGEIGLYFFALAASYFSNAFLFIPVDYFQQAHISKSSEKKQAVKTMLVFNRQIAISYAVFVLSAGYLVYLSNQREYLLLFSIAAAGAYALHVMQSLRNLLNNLGHSKTVSSNQILEAFSRVAIFFSACLFGVASVEMIATAWAISLVMASAHLILAGLKFDYFNGTAVERVHLKQFIRYATPISFSALTNWFQLQGYRVVLVPLGYAEVVGIFSTISNIGSSAIGAVNLIFQQKFNPKIYQTQGEFTKQYLRYGGVVILATIMGVALVGQPVVHLLTTTEFREYWPLILYGVVSDSANLVVGALMIHFSLKGTTGPIFVFSVTGLFVNILLFTILYTADSITVYAIGLPILVSQWIVAGLLFYQFRMRSQS